jgi:hypothetical protein
MRRLLVLGTMIFSIVSMCSAATCTGGTLSDYLGLGSAGCTIGAATFANFQTLSGITGATPIATLDVNVNPGGGSFGATLTFATNQTASAGGLLESIFTFDVSGPSYSGASLALSNSSETADGAVTGLENFCAGGSFGPDGVSGCSGMAGSLLTLDGIQNQDQTLLGPNSFIQVTDDFTLDAGLGGSATGGTLTDSFTATPEPSTFFLLGLVSLIGMGIRISRTDYRVREYARRQK